jgi:serine protease Do
MSTALGVMVLCGNVLAGPTSLAPYIPRMTAPVVNVRASRQLVATSLPLVSHLLPRRQAQALGSGVIIDPHGLVLTNDHIVDGASEVRATLVDGRELKAKVVGRDPQLDVAVLRLETDQVLPWARLGDSSRLRVGDVVVAIGNPYGLSHTVTSGIVSADERVLPVGPDVPLIQTDASINPGSSGGPLYDLHGRVVGMNTAIVAGANGIGFAVPVDVIRQALPQLQARGHVTRGFLGVGLRSVPPDLAHQAGLPTAHGALVSHVVPGSPGARAGIQAGDVIVRWNESRTNSWAALPWQIALTPPGTRVKVRLLRAGAPHEVAVQMGSAD